MTQRLAMFWATSFSLSGRARYVVNELAVAEGKSMRELGLFIAKTLQEEAQAYNVDGEVPIISITLGSARSIRSTQPSATNWSAWMNPTPGTCACPTSPLF
jgi:hypothetical protein